MFNSVVQQIAHHVERQDSNGQVRHSDVSGQSGSVARAARSTEYEPNLKKKMKVEQSLCPSRTVDDEDHMRIENSQLEQARSSSSLEDHVLQRARRDPRAIHRAAQKQTICGHVQ